ncbi:hypothetical protein ACFQH3_06620 [Haladaptatus sp. GCM10025707]|uniref:hypothetical protein n=1 Tax=unclassified Haladaptatus TaxID=2622732 RepID=UPI0023E7BD8F|nr:MULTISPECIES: hypothetical protein [unclassified Haladaptatus]
MNKLAGAGAGRWELAPHAYIIVYEAPAGDELITIYDCGAAQKPPSAQFIGHLVRVDANCDVSQTQTGYIVRMHESAHLEEQDDDHWVIRA